MKWLHVFNLYIMKFILSIVVYLSFSMSHLLAAPFKGQIQQFKQPDGSMVDVRLFGNEFYIRAEGLDEYTLIRDKTTGWICYASLSEDKMKLVSTGIVYKGVRNNLTSLRNDIPIAKHTDILPIAQKNEVKKNRILLEVDDKENALSKNSIDHRITGTPTGLLSGNIKGLCIVVDFSDEIGTLPMAEFDNFCNDLAYNNFGNTGSLRKFYKDISGGLVDYQNVVYGYFRAPLTFAEYDAMPYAQGAKQILGLALNWIATTGFDFSTLSVNPDGSIQAINLMYTGNPPNWAQGMWFHKGNYTGFSSNGVFSNDYNCSPANNPLTLATVAHENGHMICKWPDTYKYDNLSGPDGIGSFDLMCWFGSSTDPVPPNPLFRSNVGWGKVVDVTNFNGLNTDTANSMTCYRFRNLNDTNEFFLLENRLKTGRSASIPDEGLTIWHIDRNGNNQTTHHEVWLEHADNNYSSESNACFSSAFNPEYSYSTTPGSNFYNGNPSGLRVWDIGAVTNNMTYKLGRGTAGPSLNLMYVGLTGDNNLNGFIEPLESANIKVNALNLGQLSSNQSTVTCTAIGLNSGFVSVNTSPINIGVINVGQTIPTTFNISIAANTPLGTEIELQFLISDGANSIYITKKIIVGVIVLMNNIPENVCSSIFYDASGENVYNDNTDYIKTISPLSSGQLIKTDFIIFDIEDEASCGYDYLKIYDGPSNSSPLLGTFCGTNSPGQIISTDASGALTFEFHSDAGYATIGWKAIISCVNVNGLHTNSLVDFNLYPNPSSGFYNLRLNKKTNAQLTVLDVVGKEVFTRMLDSEQEIIDLSHEPNGLYFIKMQVGSDVLVKKVSLNK